MMVGNRPSTWCPPFDDALQQSMQAGTPDINVVVMGDLTVNNIPNRLGNWLSVIMENGELDYEPLKPNHWKYWRSCPCYTSM